MTERPQVDEILRLSAALFHSAQRRRQALELLVGTETLNAAAAAVARLQEASGQAITPGAVRRALSRWVEETAERMLSDVQGWTGPSSPIDDRFFELLHEESTR